MANAGQFLGAPPPVAVTGGGQFGTAANPYNPTTIPTDPTRAHQLAQSLMNPDTGLYGGGKLKSSDVPQLTGMSPYQDYSHFSNAAQGWGNAGGQLFGAPQNAGVGLSQQQLSQEALGSSSGQQTANAALGIMGAGVAGVLPGQQTAEQAAALQRQSAMGQSQTQNAATQAQNMGALSAAGGSTGQLSAQGLNSQLGQFGQGTASPQLDAARANAGLASFGAGQSAGQGANVAANRGLAQFGAGATAPQSREQNAMALLQQAAEGRAPSVAQQQMVQGEQQALRQAQSQAGSTRGQFGLANAQAGAMAAAARGAQETNAQQGILRAGEMAQARGQYMGAAQGVTQEQLGAQQALAGATLGTSGQNLAAQGQYAQQQQAGAALAEQAQQAAAGYGYEGAGQQITAQGQLMGATNQAAQIQATAQAQQAQDAIARAQLEQQYAQGGMTGAANLAGLQLQGAQAYGQQAQSYLGQQLGYTAEQQQAALQQATQAANLATAQGNLDINQQAQNTAAQQVQNQWTGQLAGTALSAGGALLASDERMKSDISSAMDWSGFSMRDNRISREDPYGDERYIAPPDMGDHLIRENPYGPEHTKEKPYDFEKAGRGVMNAGAALMQPSSVNIPQGPAAQASPIPRSMFAWPETPNLNAELSGPVSDEREKKEMHRETPLNPQPWPPAGITSDERAKMSVHDSSPVMRQLDAFDPKTFAYRDPRMAPNPQAGAERHLGVIAQDVARGPAGRTLVQTGPEGMLHLNTPAMVGTLAAGEGALKRRTDDHDARLRALEKVFRRAS